MKAKNSWQIEGQMTIFDLLNLDTPSMKTSAEHLAQTKERTSELSSKKSAKSQTVMPMFLDLRTGSGLIAAASWEMGGALLGEYMMHSFGEYPKEENVSHLSQILEAQPHQKYCLSARACQGILRRAEARGRELPPILRDALIRQSVSKNVPDVVGGKGILIQNDRTGALQTSNNQAVLSVANVTQDTFIKAGESGKAYTILSRDYKNPQAVCYGLDRASFNQGKNAKYGFAVEEELSPTLVAKGPGAVAERITNGNLERHRRV